MTLIKRLKYSEILNIIEQYDIKDINLEKRQRKINLINSIISHEKN